MENGSKSLIIISYYIITILTKIIRMVYIHTHLQTSAHLRMYKYRSNKGHTKLLKYLQKVDR